MTRSEFARLLRGKSVAQGAKRILITESDPRKFMAAFARAAAGDAEVFLCNPDWGWVEQKQLDELLKQKPDRAIAAEMAKQTGDLKPEIGQSQNPQVSGFRSQVSLGPGLGWLMIPTGGTGGQVRFARHDAATLAAAVRGFTRHFGLAQVNAAGVLPMHHVSGLMAWLRCVLTGGEYLPLDWKAVEGGSLPSLPKKAEGWTLSLVPTQLERLLKNCRAASPNAATPAGQGNDSRRGCYAISAEPPSEKPPYSETETVAWLRQFRIIFLGGAPAWPALLDQAAALHLPLAPGYGMTETAAMIAAVRPGEFLAGTRSNGSLLPHARITFDEEGSILAGGDSLFRGYWPAGRAGDYFATQDGGWLDDRGHLHVTGRRDAVIISGGEKVNPAEVEAVLRGTGAFLDVVVFGVPDTEWGESVVAAYPADGATHLAAVEAAMIRLLSPAKRPKRFVPLTDWPVNAQGKVNRAEVARRAI